MFYTDFKPNRKTFRFSRHIHPQQLITIYTHIHTRLMAESTIQCDSKHNQTDTKQSGSINYSNLMPVAC